MNPEGFYWYKVYYPQNSQKKYTGHNVSVLNVSLGANAYIKELKGYHINIPTVPNIYHQDEAVMEFWSSIIHRLF